MAVNKVFSELTIVDKPDGQSTQATAKTAKTDPAKILWHRDRPTLVSATGANRPKKLTIDLQHREEFHRTNLYSLRYLFEECEVPVSQWYLLHPAVRWVRGALLGVAVVFALVRPR